MQAPACTCRRHPSRQPGGAGRRGNSQLCTKPCRAAQTASGNPSACQAALLLPQQQCCTRHLTTSPQSQHPRRHTSSTSSCRPARPESHLRPAVCRQAQGKTATGQANNKTTCRVRPTQHSTADPSLDFQDRPLLTAQPSPLNRHHWVGAQALSLSAVARHGPLAVSQSTHAHVHDRLEKPQQPGALGKDAQQKCSARQFLFGPQR